MLEITRQFRGLQRCCRGNCPRTIKGFTLIELVVTLTIAGLLVLIAVPSMQQVLAGNRLTSLTNRLVSSIHFARSEAVTRNGPVVICSNNATSTDWSGGWSVKTGNHCATGELLKVVESTDAALAVAGVTEIIFRGDGTTTMPGGSSAKFKLENEAENFELVNARFTRQVIVKSSGHVSSQPDAKAATGVVE